MISLSSDDGGCEQCILTSSMWTALGEAIRREHGQPEADAGVWAGMWIDGVLPGIIRSSLEICPRVVVDLLSDSEPVWRYDLEVILVPLGDEVIWDDEQSRTPYPRRRRSPHRRGREETLWLTYPTGAAVGLFRWDGCHVTPSEGMAFLRVLRLVRSSLVFDRGDQRHAMERYRSVLLDSNDDAVIHNSTVRGWARHTRR